MAQRKPKRGNLLKTINLDIAFDVTFGEKNNSNVYCPWCESSESSKSQSCSVSTKGIFNCKSCKNTGNAFEFYAKIYDITLKEAEEKLLNIGDAAHKKTYKRRDNPTENHNRTHTHPGTLEQYLAIRCNTALHEPSNKKWLKYLTKNRGLDVETIDYFNIGCDEYRITIPIYNSENHLANIRRYLPNPPDKVPKMCSHLKGDGSPILYPLIILDDVEENDTLIICEGEWDCLLLNQLGFPAITNTGSVNVWSHHWTDLLRVYNLIIIFDVNDKENLGQRTAWERAKVLHKAGANVKVIELPLPPEYIGGDITDYFVNEHHTATDLQNLINETTYVDDKNALIKLDDIDETKVSTEVPRISLHDAASSNYFYENIRIRCLIAGKGVAPYIIPKKIQLDIRDENGVVTTEHRTFDAWSSIILSMTDCTDAAQIHLIRVFLNIPKKHSVKITILESMNIEEIYLIPAIDQDNDQGQYTIRQCYYVGHGLETNRVYDFEGYTLPHPKTQQATHILTSAQPAETNIDSFELTEDVFHELSDTFQCDNVFDKLNHIADDFAEHVTKIYGRRDLHLAVDLVFHSPLHFNFDDVRIRKGWLEALILGDTRTGKGFVTEGLARHYGVGEVISGENLTLAGLIGGVQRLGDRWTLVWGKLPLSDKRLIIMDECSSLTHSDISKLSRIRSEGIAEVTKIRSEKTTSRTRLIWLANPRSSGNAIPKELHNYNHGIEAVPELIGAAEDVARFDFVLIVAKNEVDTELINQSHVAEGNLQYTSDLCKKLIMWIWSRTAAQIKFSKGAIETAFKASKELGKRFISRISLIQSEDVRFKLVRIACAAAGRTFSTKDGINLLVTKDHMEFAYNFLRHIYSKECCGYLQLSTIEKERSTLRDPHQIIEILEAAGESLADLIDGLLEHRKFTARDLSDYAGLDIVQAKMLISELVRYRAIIKDHNNAYVKKPSFKPFLMKLKAKITKEQNVTQEEEETKIEKE